MEILWVPYRELYFSTPPRRYQPHNSKILRRYTLFFLLDTYITWNSFYHRSFCLQLSQEDLRILFSLKSTPSYLLMFLPPINVFPIKKSWPLIENSNFSSPPSLLRTLDCVITWIVFSFFMVFYFEGKKNRKVDNPCYVRNRPKNHVFVVRYLSVFQHLLQPMQQTKMYAFFTTRKSELSLPFILYTQ